VFLWGLLLAGGSPIALPPASLATALGGNPLHKKGIDFAQVNAKDFRADSIARDYALADVAPQAFD
jgi:hypothetical protein